ncbi:FtsK/SpoIIIE domain-containing protein [Streptomyces sp. ACA25]|uniref:FtsK/SpoIIIE domain-containing protein n=1 Tax=Streptomyces sp. ACA25 TaxID=3022596 RepID=UPI0023075ECB|nr:FtsK/SpoIIIE domain-containing protein [Streptomyces sp. ACA25]MDB1086465.1 FtsK/SpoIIIE domain-containing protein [Streptomyces sp. ACA25]
MTDTTTVNGSAPPVRPTAITLTKPSDATAPTIQAPVPETFRPTEERPPVLPAADEENEGRGPRPVDPPGLAVPGVRGEVRRPILAPWLTHRADLFATLGRAGGRAGYVCAYHGLRTIGGIYPARLAFRAPVGAARLVRGTWRWASDAESAPLRTHAVSAQDSDEYLRLDRTRVSRVRWRSLVLAVALLFGTAGALALYIAAPGWLAVVAAVSVAALGMAGQERDRPVIGPAVQVTEVPKLTSSLVLRGLDAIGHPRITAAIKKGGEMNGMRFTSEITRDGPGYRAELDLPYGVTPDDVMDKRTELASGLRRKLGCVWPSGDPGEHEGRLVLWVGDKPMNETRRPAWPLAKKGTVDLFAPVAFGNDQRMREVEVTLMFASVVVGSIPRMGKTFLMRLLLLIAALDPRAELHAFDFKGTGDFRALEPVCHRYRAGEEDEDIEYVLASLRELRDELRRRAKVIKSLPLTRCPESKVTPELANDRALGLHPVVVGLDECQVAFEHPEHGAELEAICTDLVKRGPALGMVAMFGTQRPDAKSLPKGISDNAVLRFCLKVMSQVANDMVLGQSMYKSGYRATMFARSDKGICWMAGEGDDPRIVASTFIDAPAAKAIAARARAARDAYGNITGHAAGHAPETPDEGPDVLADVLAVLEAGEDKAWSETIAARLAALRPQVYAGWQTEQLTAALKPHGVRTRQVWGTTDAGKGANRRGITRASITTAMTEREQNRDRD